MINWKKPIEHVDGSPAHYIGESPQQEKIIMLSNDSLVRVDSNGALLSDELHKPFIQQKIIKRQGFMNVIRVHQPSPGSFHAGGPVVHVATASIYLHEDEARNQVATGQLGKYLSIAVPCEWTE